MFKKYVTLLSLVLVSTSFAAMAKTDIELSLSATQSSLKVGEKLGPEAKVNDDFKAINLGIGAYRWVTEDSAWGVVVEYAKPLDRDDAFPGSGTTIGIRPVNWRYQWTNNLSSELFLGAAKYSWKKAAIGYYTGAELSYAPRMSAFRLGLQFKYYRDLAYDTSNGDLFVNGPSYGLVFGYKF
ncbi:hypothetical protein JQC92_05790 [Shewanella sp. 202IG2-18]|uniref:hypothetical protein n=1 Tax=Parashewanella hymeniacidonis TaxID=2807618 RepID=UPI0019610646|nr:hypothetical protein [Parashewanella hymeniacidonis]MBM7071551.1 hypothetical protein [Parashewanella hymeniacidonis]